MNSVRTTTSRRAGSRLRVVMTGIAMISGLGLLMPLMRVASAAPTRPVPRTVPGWTHRAPVVGRPAPTQQVWLKVYLAPTGGLGELRTLATAVSTPGSGTYRHFISAAEYHRRFDPADAAVDTVSTWLSGHGLRLVGVEAHRRYLDVRGTVQQVQRALGVTLNLYRRSGRIVRANASSVQVPAQIAPYVSGVSGLDTSPARMSHRHVDASPAVVASARSSTTTPVGVRTARPCSSSYGQLRADKQADFSTPLPTFRGTVVPYAVCGYTGPQLRTAYEDGSALAGRQVTVAVTDAYASSTLAADVATYAARHGDGSWFDGQLTQVLPTSTRYEDECDPGNWAIEQTLDVEAVHAMAPSANVRYYGASSCLNDDFLSTLGTVMDEDRASIVVNSWGDVEANESSAGVAAFQSLFLQGALQGMSFLFASGDAGDELTSTGLRQVDYPASDPYVTAVGGTSAGIGRDGRLTFETGWGTRRWVLSPHRTSWLDSGFRYGSGGGGSTLFNQPGYQQGVVPDRYGAARTVPDIALDADPTTGMLIGLTQTFPGGIAYGERRIGGTSLAAPLYAGLVALAVEAAGGRVGLLNPQLYAQAGTEVLHDLSAATPPSDPADVRVDYVNGVEPSAGLTYSIETFGENSSLPLAAGWDEATGLGAPAPGWLTSVPSRDPD